MAVEGVLAAIELCELVVKTTKSIYEASKNVETCFEKQRVALGRKIKDLTTNVEQVKKALQHMSLEDSGGIQSVLRDIIGFCLRVQNFFGKLDKLKGYKGAKFIRKSVTNYFDIQNQFKDINRILPDLNDRLNNSLAAYSFMLAVNIHQTVDTRREFENEQIDRESLRNLAENEDPVDMEVETTFQRIESIERKGFTEDDEFSIKPGEISNEQFYGNFSTAYWKKEKVMILRIPVDADENMKEGFTREKRNLMFFSCGSIVRVFGVCDEPSEKFLVLEYMEQGKLSDVLHKSDKILNWETKLRLAKTAASAFYRMHQKLLHTSMRTEMFLVDEHYTAKLSGLQTAKRFSSAPKVVQSHPIVDADRYLAPERFQPSKPTKQADVYGFGIVLWEIFTQTKPFSVLQKETGKEPTPGDIKKFLLVDKREEYLVGDQSDPSIAKVSEIIRKCRAIDPGQRPDSGEIFDVLNKMYDEMKYRELQKDQ